MAAENGCHVGLKCGIWRVSFQYDFSAGVLAIFIDLFTDTSAILNLVDLRSIMGCPGGICWGIYACFSCEKRTSLFITREKVIIITSKQGKTTFFLFIKIFFQKNLQKNWPEKRA